MQGSGITSERRKRGMMFRMADARWFVPFWQEDREGLRRGRWAPGGLDQRKLQLNWWPVGRGGGSNERGRPRLQTQTVRKSSATPQTDRSEEWWPVIGWRVRTCKGRVARVGRWPCKDSHGYRAASDSDSGQVKSRKTLFLAL